MNPTVSMKAMLLRIPDPVYVGKIIRCPALGAEVLESVCLERVLALSDTAALDTCRRCLRGRAMMETLRGVMPERFFEHLPPLEVAMAKQEKKSDRKRKVAEAAGISVGTLYTILSLQRKGKDMSSPCERRVQEALNKLGMRWSDIGGVDLPAGDAPASKTSADFAPEAGQNSDQNEGDPVAEDTAHAETGSAFALKTGQNADQKTVSIPQHDEAAPDPAELDAAANLIETMATGLASDINAGLGAEAEEALLFSAMDSVSFENLLDYVKRRLPDGAGLWIKL